MKIKTVNLVKVEQVKATIKKLHGMNFIVTIGNKFLMFEMPGITPLFISKQMFNTTTINGIVGRLEGELLL